MQYIDTLTTITDTDVEMELESKILDATSAFWKVVDEYLIEKQNVYFLDSSVS